MLHCQITKKRSDPPLNVTVLGNKTLHAEVDQALRAKHPTTLTSLASNGIFFGMVRAAAETKDEDEKETLVGEVLLPTTFRKIPYAKFKRTLLYPRHSFFLLQRGSPYTNFV